jgi:hypothetical protein
MNIQQIASELNIGLGDALEMEIIRRDFMLPESIIAKALRLKIREAKDTKQRLKLKEALAEFLRIRTEFLSSF